MSPRSRWRTECCSAPHRKSRCPVQTCEPETTQSPSLWIAFVRARLSKHERMRLVAYGDADPPPLDSKTQIVREGSCSPRRRSMACSPCSDETYAIWRKTSSHQHALPSLIQNKDNKVLNHDAQRRDSISQSKLCLHLHFLRSSVRIPRSGSDKRSEMEFQKGTANHYRTAEE